MKTISTERKLSTFQRLVEYSRLMSNEDALEKVLAEEYLKKRTEHDVLVELATQGLALKF